MTAKSEQCTGVVNLVDMYPTLIELCGLPENPVLDGRSFAPLLRNPERQSVRREPKHLTRAKLIEIPEILR